MEQNEKVNEWVKEQDRKFQNDPEYVLDWILLVLSEKILERLDEKGWTKKKFAIEFGVSQPYITKLIKGKPNLTLESLVKIALCLDLKPIVEFDKVSRPIQEKKILCDSSGYKEYQISEKYKSKNTKNEKVNYIAAA